MGALVHARLALDAGDYQRVGELRPEQPGDEPSLAGLQAAHETVRERARAPHA